MPFSFKAIVGLLVLSLMASCTEKTPPLPIPPDMEGFPRYDDIYMDYEFDEKDRMTARFSKTYYIIDTETNLGLHYHWTYFYNEDDSISLTRYENLLTKEKGRQVYEYGPHGLGRYFMINAPEDTVVIENHAYNDQGQLVKLESGSLIDFEEEAPEWIWRHERYSYDSLGRKTESKATMTQPYGQARVLYEYDPLRRIQKTTFYEKEGDSTLLFTQLNEHEAPLYAYQVEANGDSAMNYQNTYQANGIDLKTKTTFLVGQKLSLGLYNINGKLETEYKYHGGEETSVTQRFYKNGRVWRILTGYSEL